MTIHRIGPTPFFSEYIARNALVPNHAPSTCMLQQLLFSDSQWVDIPRYQRGISWKVDNVIEFIESTSVLLGSVILAQFIRGPGMFPNIPPQYNTYATLVDGLQRLGWYNDTFYFKTLSNG